MSASLIGNPAPRSMCSTYSKKDKEHLWKLIHEGAPTSTCAGEWGGG